MDLAVTTKVDERQLMELYLNSLLNSDFVSSTADVVEIVDNIHNNVTIDTNNDLLPTILLPVQPKENISVKILFFQLADITIATPVLGVFKVISLSEHQNCIANIPGLSAHSHGIITVQNKSFELINISKLILPQITQENFTLTLDNSKYLLLVSETAHAVICQNIVDFKDIKMANIKKVKNKYNCFWHIGTIMPDMIPFIDLIALARAFSHKKC